MAAPVLVTGVNGFVGKHLVRELTASGLNVIGTGRQAVPEAQIAGELIRYIPANLAREQITLPNLAGVVHLAGIAAVGPSFDAPKRYIAGNTAMLANLCEQFLRWTVKPRILVVSTGAIYDCEQPMPVPEDGRIAYSSPYVVSKLALEALAHYYVTRGLDLLIARPFNHVGPGQGPGFLVPDLLSGLSKARESRQPLKVGNLSAARDYTDVRDIVRAYRILLQTKKAAGTFNIASGKTHTGQEILAVLNLLLGQEPPPTIADPAKLRPHDPRLIAGDASRLREVTGWRPLFDLQGTLRDAIEHRQLAPHWT